MPSTSKCPIFEVDGALASYIHSREETHNIRQAISKYLTSNLRPVKPAVRTQHLNHACPQNLSATSKNPPGLSGARAEYLDAIRLRGQAHTRHDNLQTSLQELYHRHIDEIPIQPEPEYDNEVMRGYVSLLKQRRRHAELRLIQDSLDKVVLAKPDTSHIDLKILVKNKIGEPPNLPAEKLEVLSSISENQSTIFRLKQEVLEAKASMEKAQSARENAQSKGTTSSKLSAQIHALENARSEIVEWVQGELAKLEEDSIFLEDASPVKRATHPIAPIDTSAAEQQIRRSYNEYTSARANLLDAHLSLQQPILLAINEDGASSVPSPERCSDTFRAKLATAKCLPYLPSLSQISKNERSLLQQSVYLQAQIASMDQNIEEALSRLSGESHLVPAGTKNISAWIKAASEAETSTEQFINEQLQSCVQEINNVKIAVELCSLQSKVLDEV